MLAVMEPIAKTQEHQLGAPHEPRTQTIPVDMLSFGLGHHSAKSEKLRIQEARGGQNPKTSERRDEKLHRG